VIALSGGMVVPLYGGWEVVADRTPVVVPVPVTPVTADVAVPVVPVESVVCELAPVAPGDVVAPVLAADDVVDEPIIDEAASLTGPCLLWR
jgi:hypothetical protein